MARSICPFYLQNRCVYGDSCANIHSWHTHKQFPLSKPLPCKFFLQGHCHHGDKCTFSHNLPVHSANSQYSYHRSCADQVKPATHSPNIQLRHNQNGLRSNNIGIKNNHSGTRFTHKTSSNVSDCPSQFSFRQTEQALYDQLNEVKSNNIPSKPKFQEWGFQTFEVYSSDNQLTSESLAIYNESSDAFIPGKVPLCAPSEHLCSFS